jgi:toxin ParE1/3/4
MGWKIRLSAHAEQDARSILSWTRTHFGSRQAEAYAMTLSLALEALFEGPAILGVKARPDLGPDIGTLHVARKGRRGRHFIIFRANHPDTLDVLRILHDSMDLPRHVLEDC